jgi:hypothetical protein
MRRWYVITSVALGLVSAVATGRGQSPFAGKPNFSGAWTLNTELSDAPMQSGVSANESDRGAGRGRSGGMGPGGYRGERFGPTVNRSDQRSALEELTSELTNPSASLMISHAGPTLTITDAKDRTRLFQTNGQSDPHQVGAATVPSTTRWDGDRLVTEYDLGSGRRIRIVYSLIPATRQLVEQVTFANGQTMKRVYDPARSIRRR